MNAILKIDGFSNYEIYPKDGKIWSNTTNKFIGSNNDGYSPCALMADDGSIWRTNIHRVIYTACYGDIPEGMQVNHIDEDKNNNSIFNVNLMTPKENTNWGTRNERASKTLKGTRINRIDESKPVGAYKDGKLVMTFPSTAEAGRNGFDHSCIGKCCRGVKNYNSHKGYEWRYID